MGCSENGGSPKPWLSILKRTTSGWFWVPAIFGNLHMGFIKGLYRVNIGIGIRPSKTTIYGKSVIKTSLTNQFTNQKGEFEQERWRISIMQTATQQTNGKGWVMSLAIVRWWFNGDMCHQLCGYAVAIWIQRDISWYVQLWLGLIGYISLYNIYIDIS